MIQATAYSRTEVEAALLSHDAVAEAAVVGSPDHKWVEAVVAFIVLRPGQTADANEIIGHVASQIASYKKPHRIIPIEAIQKTAVGKIDRKVLRARLLQEGDRP